MSRSAVSLAWSWRHAFSRSDLPPSTKLVLHTLGMFMNEFGESCHPSVADICRHSGLDKKTVLKHLGLARDAGWIAVSQHGYRGQRWKRQEYVACWPERDLVAPCPPDDDGEGGGVVPPPSGAGKVVESVPEGGGIEGSKVVEPLHQDKTSPDTTPVTSPVEREAREREDETGDQPVDADTPGKAAFSKRVMRLCSGRGFSAGKWEDWDTVAPNWIERGFAGLTPQERLDAERWRDAYLLDVRARGKQPIAIGNWLRGKAWTGLEPSVLERFEQQRNRSLAPEERQQPDGWAPCLGPVGMAYLLSEMLAGPADADLAARPFLSDPQLRDAWPGVWWWQAHQRQKGGTLFDPAWHALKSLMEFVPHGTDVMADWRQAFADRGWRWLAVFDGGKGMWLPKGGPAGLEAFEAAVREQSAEAAE